MSDDSKDWLCPGRGLIRDLCFLCFGPETRRQRRTQEGGQRRSRSVLGVPGLKAWTAGPEWDDAVSGWPPQARSGAVDGQTSGSPCDCVPFGLGASWPVSTSVTGLGCATRHKEEPQSCQDLLAPRVKMVPGWSMTTRQPAGQGRSRAESGMRTDVSCTPGPSDAGRVERTLRRGEGGHRWVAGRLGCRLEGPQQPPGCRSSCGTDTLTPQRKAGLGSPQTLTAGGTSPCEVAELVLSPGCAGPPGDFTKAGAGPPPRCWSVWSGEWLGHQEPTKLPSSPAPRVRPAPGAALGSTGAGGDEGPDSGFLRPFFPHGLQFSLLCDGSRHPFPCVFPPGLGATGEAHAHTPRGN